MYRRFAIAASALATIFTGAQPVAAQDYPTLYLYSPYYLVPDGDVGQQAFAVIREAIRKEGMVALGRVVFTSREHVIALPRQALDEASADRVDDTHEHDRHSASRLQQRRQDRGASGQDDVGRERDHFRGISANVGGIA